MFHPVDLVYFVEKQLNFLLYFEENLSRLLRENIKFGLIPFSSVFEMTSGSSNILENICSRTFRMGSQVWKTPWPNLPISPSYSDLFLNLYVCR